MVVAKRGSVRSLQPGLSGSVPPTTPSAPTAAFPRASHELRLCTTTAQCPCANRPRPAHSPCPPGECWLPSLWVPWVSWSPQALPVHLGWLEPRACEPPGSVPRLPVPLLCSLSVWGIDRSGEGLFVSVESVTQYLEGPYCTEVPLRSVCPGPQKLDA